MPIAEQVSALPVSVPGFTWSAFFGMLAVLINGTGLAVWLKTRPQMRGLVQSADEKIRDDLTARVDKLEGQLDQERVRHEAERAQHDAIVAIMRHRLNNSDQCLEALLLVLDDDDLPPKVKRAVLAIKEMRTRQRADEALEKATIHAARIASAGAPVPPSPDK